MNNLYHLFDEIEGKSNLENLLRYVHFKAHGKGSASILALLLILHASSIVFRNDDVPAKSTRC